MAEKIELILSLSRLQTKFQKRIDQCLSVHGIGFSEFLVMYHLNKAPNQTMRRIDLAESLGMTASGVTRLVNPMEKTHLVQKEQNPRDARVSLVQLSTAGAEILADATTSFGQAAEDLLQPLGEKQLGSCVDLVGLLL